MEGDSEHDSSQEYYLGSNPINTSGNVTLFLDNDGFDNDKADTATVNGNEHTFEIHDVDEFGGADKCKIETDGNNNTYDEGDSYLVDGWAVWVDGCSTSNGDDFINLEIMKPYTFQNGNIDILFTIEDQGGTGVLDVKRGFYATNGNSKNPAVTFPKANDTLINPFDTQSITTGASTSGYLLSEPTNDDWNVTLNRESDDKTFFRVEKKSGNLLLEGVRTGVENTLYLLGIENNDNATFQMSPLSNGYLDQSNTQYEWYYEVEDSGVSVRRTASFTVDTTGSNSAPVIDGIEGDTGNGWKNITDFNSYNETLNEIRVNYTDSNFVYGNLSLKASYCNDVYFDESNKFNSSDGQIYWGITNSSKQRIINSGNWTVSVNLTDGAEYANRTYNWEIDWGNPSQSLTVNGSSGNVDLEVNETTFWNSTVTDSQGRQISATCDSTNHTLDPVKIEKDSSSFLARLSEYLYSLGGELV